MITTLLSKANLNLAYQRVVRNRGAGGVDTIEVSDLKVHLDSNGRELVEQIKEGSYQPSAIKGVRIPKGNGKTRLLGIPTTTDRVFQQALHQMLSPLFEPSFQTHSYGFRPNRNAHQAVLQSQSNINAGKKWIVDIDLKNFFDEVDHAILLELIYEKVSCAMTLKLLRKFLRAPILIDGKLRKRKKGVPQGSPLSPLLSNILLNELDKELEKRRHAYVRYADDFSIYVSSYKAARRVGNSLFKFLKDKLHLPINRSKSGIRRPRKFGILGYGFVPSYRKGSKGEYRLVVQGKKWKAFLKKLKTITCKTHPVPIAERLLRLKRLCRGWLNYFKLASIKTKLKALDEWLRNRLRYCIWHFWKKPNKRQRSLIRLGVEKGMAYAWSRSRMGGWRIAQSPILGTTISLSRLKQKGYLSMSDYYYQLRSS